MSEPLDPKVREFVSSFVEQSRQGMTIDGFGPHHPPPPPLPTTFREVPPHQPEPEPIDDPDDEHDEVARAERFIDKLPDSPLLRIARPAPAQPPAPFRPENELMVTDELASYLGQTVVLNGKEKAQIAQVVLKALRKRIDEQYSQIVGRRPRAPKQEAPRLVIPKKRRGRPPKETA